MPVQPGSRDTLPPAAIDVAIPCYQYGHLLRDCVTSVLDQGLQSVRVLIIDNASMDDSLEVAQQLAAEHPAVEVVAHPRNLGPHASFNEAIDWAAQKYFLLLCADDMSAPGALARALSVLEQHPNAVLSYGRAALIGAGGALGCRDPDADNAAWRVFAGDQLLERFCSSGVCHIAGCTALVRTEVQKQVGYYRPELPHTDDFEMWMRFARHGAAAETSAIQGIMRDHAASQSAFVRQQHRWDILHCEDAFESFFAREGSQLADAEHWYRLAKRSLGARAYWSALSHFSRGELDEGLAILRIALKLLPTCPVLPPITYLLRREDARARLSHALSRLLRSRDRGNALRGQA